MKTIRMIVGLLAIFLIASCGGMTGSGKSGGKDNAPNKGGGRELRRFKARDE